MRLHSPQPLAGSSAGVGFEEEAVDLKEGEAAAAVEVVEVGQERMKERKGGKRQEVGSEAGSEEETEEAKAGGSPPANVLTSTTHSPTQPELSAPNGIVFSPPNHASNNSQNTTTQPHLTGKPPAQNIH